MSQTTDRETIRDDAVKFFVKEGLLQLNPDDPNRLINSGKTVCQIELTALALFSRFETFEWTSALAHFFASRESFKHEVTRKRDLARVPVTLPVGFQVALSPGGQNPLIKTIIEHFCPAFAPGGVVLYIGDTGNKFVHLETAGLSALGVTLDSAAKIPDVINPLPRQKLALAHRSCHQRRTGGRQAQQGTQRYVRRQQAGLVFVAAFENRRTMQCFVSQIAWESEVWIAEDPDHMIHFNGERFLGPYTDVMPKNP